MPGVGDVGSILGLALMAMFNPTLLAAVTVMMLLPNPRKLMLGYLLGAYLTSITVGMAIVFALHQSEGVETTKRTLGPLADLLLGALLLVVGFVLRSARGERIRERRRERKKEKEAGKEPKQPLPERLLGRGSAKITFVLGVVLSFPGVSYLAALSRISKLEWATVPTALFVLVVALIQQAFLEAPLIGYWLAPEWTQDAVVKSREWLGRNGSNALTIFAIVLGALLVLRGVVTLI
jgi:Sap, sulfolipid-1-addressing protein